MKYNEYPDITIPPYLESWEDTSWHNDVTASSTKTLDDHNIRVWVYHDNPSEREYEDVKTFVISLESSAGDLILCYSTDSESFMQIIADFLIKGFDYGK